MMLYTVHFSTLRLSGDDEFEVHHTLQALPLLTARTYQKFRNWRMEPYTISNEPTRRRNDFNTRSPDRRPPRMTPKPAPVSVKSAAETGDLAAAISGGK